MKVEIKAMSSFCMSKSNKMVVCSVGERVNQRMNKNRQKGTNGWGDMDWVCFSTERDMVQKFVLAVYRLIIYSCKHLSFLNA